MTRVFGLTGGIASGKSAVASCFRRQGVPVIDADELAREVVTPGAPALDEIRAAFGEEVMRADGTLNRQYLGQIVFADRAARERLGAITHPRIAALFARRVAELAAQGTGLVCYDVPLLFERGLEAGLRPVVVVYVPRALQKARLMARERIDDAEADRRIEAQLPLEEKRARADFVIDNSGPLETTEAQATAVLARIQKQT